jgi:hypothetical protein
MEHIRLLFLIFLTGIIFSGIVILIARFPKNGRLLKYIPSLALFAGGAACIIKARWFSEGFEGLGYVVLSITVFGGGIIALVTAAVIDMINRSRDKNK